MIKCRLESKEDQGLGASTFLGQSKEIERKEWKGRKKGKLE